jgi:radical SAM-linked protein
MVFEKVRIRFRKDGDLRLVSHHDLMRTFERMLRRAALPVRSSSGFHPKPRLVFALSLPLGVVGKDEVAELELTETIDPAEIHERLSRHAPSGLEILTIHRIDPKAGAQVCRAGYRIALPAGRAAGLPERIAALLAAKECWVERSRPRQRRYNLRPYLDQLRLEPDALEMDLWVTPTGAARAEEVLQLLGLDDVLTSGSILERIRLELQDETSTLDPVPVPVPGTEHAAQASAPTLACAACSVPGTTTGTESQPQTGF